jgi:hypothetical protein
MSCRQGLSLFMLKHWAVPIFPCAIVHYEEAIAMRQSMPLLPIEAASAQDKTRSLWVMEALSKLYSKHFERRYIFVAIFIWSKTGSQNKRAEEKSSGCWFLPGTELQVSTGADSELGFACRSFGWALWRPTCTEELEAEVEVAEMTSHCIQRPGQFCGSPELKWPCRRVFSWVQGSDFKTSDEQNVECWLTPKLIKTLGKAVLESRAFTGRGDPLKPTSDRDPAPSQGNVHLHPGGLEWVCAHYRDHPEACRLLHLVMSSKCEENVLSLRLMRGPSLDWKFILNTFSYILEPKDFFFLFCYSYFAKKQLALAIQFK